MKRIFLAALILAVTSTASYATDYTIDDVHSSVLFRAKHLGVSYFHGQFAKVSGKLSFDEAKPEASSVEITVHAESVVTFNEARDKHLKSPDFFNAKEFPVITFKSTSWKKAGDGVYAVTGTLTMLGVKKEITVNVDHVGNGKNRRGQELIGFETVFTVDRTDFGMKYGVSPDGNGIGKDVRMTLSIEAGS